MRERARRLLAGEEAWVVGGAVRDALLGRAVVDLDIACRAPEAAARRFAAEAGGAVFRLSERHGAWRVAFPDGRTVDFTPLRDGIAADLATRDFTINAIAEPLAGGEPVDPFSGRADLAAGVVRALGEHVFVDDPLRLLRAVRIEHELGFAIDPASESAIRLHAHLVDRPAGERILGELLRLRPQGFGRLDELGLLVPLGGSTELLGRADERSPAELVLVLVFGDRLKRLPVSGRLRRYAGVLLRARRPADDSPRELHRFRRQTEPWTLDALAFLDAREFAPAVEAARRRDPAEPLLRGDELGVPPGPEVGRLLELVEEERAAGTISTRKEAFELVRRHRDADVSAR